MHREVTGTPRARRPGWTVTAAAALGRLSEAGGLGRGMMYLVGVIAGGVNSYTA